MKILMVCLGNICRSPLAEGLLAAKVGDDITVDSAGTGPWHVGDPPDDRSIQVAKNHGLDISQLRGRQFSAKDFEDFDRIYVMDQSNYDDVTAQARSEEDKEKVFLILNEIEPGKNQAVPDPYHDDFDAFEDVYQVLDLATDKIAESL